MKKVLILGVGIMLVSSSLILAHNHGEGKGNGSGCKGDSVCIQERQSKMKAEKSTDDGTGINQDGYENEHKGKGEWKGVTEYQKVIDKIKNSPKGELTEWEKNYLAYRLEEEKTARDVYITLDEKWNRKPFTNIKKSEQAHLDITTALKEKYSFETEFLTKNEVGKFENPKFQKLYNELTEKGLKSWEDAIEVGMIIEDIDLHDLDESLAKAQNNDLRMVLEKFIEASSHHMQAFKKQMDKKSLVYEPKYISKDRMKVALLVPKDGKPDNAGMKKNYYLNMVDSEDVDKEIENTEKGFFVKIIEFLFGWI